MTTIRLFHAPLHRSECKAYCLLRPTSQSNENLYSLIMTYDTIALAKKGADWLKEIFPSDNYIIVETDKIDFGERE